MGVSCIITFFTGTRGEIEAKRKLQEFQKQAVEMGYGEWKLDRQGPDGRASFKWKSDNKGVINGHENR